MFYKLTALTLDYIAREVDEQDQAHVSLMLSTASVPLWALTDEERTLKGGNHKTARLLFETANRVWVEDVDAIESGGALFIALAELERILG
jgi:hypothetical protein